METNIMRFAPMALLLTCLLVVSYAIGFAVAGVTETGMQGGAPPLKETVSRSDIDGLLWILIPLGTEAIALTYMIARSRLTGVPLVIAVFLALYGAGSVGLHLESLVFLQGKMSAGTIGRMLVAGAISGALFSVVAALITKKMRRRRPPTSCERTHLNTTAWAWRLGVAGGCFVLLYLTFGYYVAWRQPAIQEYYGGTDPGSFVGQLSNIWRKVPWFVPFQFGRGLLYVACVLPLLRSLHGERWEHAIAFAIFFAGWVLLCLVPNPYMPREVAYIHLVETTPWNFLFGAIVGWMFSPVRPDFSNKSEGLSAMRVAA